jgi:integrase
MEMRARLISRRKGTWNIVLSTGKNPLTGKYGTKWITVQGTRTEAERQKNEILRQYDVTGFIANNKITVAEYLLKWMSTHELKIRENTGETYLEAINKHFIPAFGKIPLSQLSMNHLQTLYDNEFKAGLAGDSIRVRHTVIKQALDAAVAHGIIYRNIADNVHPPKSAHTEMLYWDAPEMNTFLASQINSPYYPLFHTALFTGMRRSELVALQWDDVDFVSGSVSIRRSLHYSKKRGCYFSDVKSKSSKRTIALTPSNLTVLHNFKESSEGKGGTDLIFIHNNKPLIPSFASRLWRIACMKSGVKVIRLHDARHTHATLLFKQGVPAKIVQERLGHSSIVMTMNLYSHVIPGMQKDAALKFDELFSKDLEQL